MSNPKPYTVDQSATQRMEAARSHHRETLAREMLYAAILSRLWPSYLARPKREDAMFPGLLCIDSPAGRLSYKLTEDDLAAFEHVTDRRNEPDSVLCSALDKLSRLSHLASEGW